jgi:hypothetical protein
LALVAAGSLALGAAHAAAADGRDVLVLRDAAIYTLDPARPWARTVVVASGRIVYVGDDAGAQSHVPPGARVLALHGAMVLPGFHDAHAHPLSGGLRLGRCRLDQPTADAVYAAVRACAAATPGTDWLLGAGWSRALFDGGAPTRATLDALLPGRPAFLTTDDGATAWLNSKALAIAGIDAPSGIVDGETAQAIRRHIPAPSPAEYREALHRATALAQRVGITSVFDAAANAAMLDAYRAADRAGELGVRVVAAQRVDPALGVAQVDAMIARRAALRGRRLRADAAKLFLDGEFASHDAALLAPYADAPDARGTLRLDPAALDGIVRRLDAAGFQLHLHAMGDGAVHAGLDALARAARANGPRDRRHQIAHLGLVDASDLGRFKALGVTANVQPQWAQADDPALAGITQALGARRSARLYPIGSLRAAGARLVIGSDWPSTALNPLESIQVALTRQPLTGDKPTFGVQQRIDLQAVLAALTRDAAWVAGEAATTGSIEVGKAADLVVLERNLFEVEVARLHQVRVLLTLLDGEAVWRDPDLAW